MNHTHTLILHLHHLLLRSHEPCNLKFVVFQGDQSTNSSQTKLESRKEILLTNGKANIQQAFELTASKDGKILIIILKSKQKETSFLGQLSIDTHRYVQQGLETINLESPISKCTEKDQNARLLLTVTFPKKVPLREFEIERAMNKEIKKPSPASTIEVITGSQSESTIKGVQIQPRRVSTDFHHKNYKQVQILREDKKEKVDSRPKDRSGSYKKRFEYQEGIAKPKNTIVFLKKKKEKQVEEPVPRQRTPEPIRLQHLSSSHSKSKPSALRSRNVVTERLLEKPEKMLVSIQAKTERYQTQSESKFQIKSNTFSKGSLKESTSGDKYKSLVDKLEKISLKIEDKKSVDQSISRYGDSMIQDSGRGEQTSICTFGDTVKTSMEDAMLPTTDPLSNWKTIQLEDTITQLTEELANKDALLEKLTQRYQRMIQEVETVKEPYQQQIETLKTEIDRLKVERVEKTTAPSDTQLRVELKNEKRKNMNLDNSLMLKENEMKHLKLSVELLEDERRQLQQLLAQKEARAGTSSSRALLESELMTNGYPSSIKCQNQLLRSQNHLLQKHIQELNQLVEQYELNNSRGINLLKDKELEDLRNMISLLNKNVLVLQDKSSKLELKLQSTKLNFAEVMNVVLEKGGEHLVELIENNITKSRDSGTRSQGGD